MDVIEHYDLLVEEGNDPFRDPPDLIKYMDRWDGDAFIDLLNPNGHKSVLEIGVGTGRLAHRIAPRFLKFVGIDISPKTVDRARKNLSCHGNVTLICDDFVSHKFSESFDVIYSSLTFMHFEDKANVIEKIHGLLKTGGIFCLSIDKSDDEYIDMGIRRLRIYPDDLELTLQMIRQCGMHIRSVSETEAAFLIASEVL